MERKEYTRYSREFKLEALRLAASGKRLKAGIRSNQVNSPDWALIGVAEGH